jgi:DNA-binding LacI/PurR family transcriptional regulator
MCSKRLKRATAQDVADLAGVSRFTVKRAFSKDAYIAEDKRTRVLEAAQSLGYRPNAMARSLKSQSSSLVGIVSGALDNEYDAHVTNHLVRLLVAAGKWPVVFGGSSDGIRQGKMLDILEFPLAALIIRAGSVDAAVAEQCVKMGVPAIAAGRSLNVDGPGDSICCDNIRGATLAANCLADRGRKRIGYIGGPEQLTSSQERQQGFTQRCATLGLELVAQTHSDFTFDGGAKATGELLQNHPQIDGLFCANDAMAIGALSMARTQFGRDVPKDLSIIGFDDIAMARWPLIQLTTIQNPAETVAERIMNQLTRRLSNPEAKPSQIRYTPQIALRATH